MADVVAQIQVLSQEAGCLLDLTALLQDGKCPNVNIKTEPQHIVKQEGDTICVTPSQSPHKRSAPCDSCFTPDQEICDQNTVELDLELLVLLDLLTEAELNAYLNQMGVSPSSDSSGNGNGNNTPPKTAKVNPLLSLNAGGNNSLADLKVGQGKPPLLDLGVGKDGKLLALGLDGQPVLTLRRRKDKLLDAQVGGTAKEDADIDVNLLTTPPHKLEAACDTCDEHYLTHYQPICQKSFGNKDNAKTYNAVDINHCLAQCNAQSALLSIQAGSIADVLVCLGAEYDSSSSENNCNYFVGPESQPCEDSDLVESDTGYTFIRN